MIRWPLIRSTGSKQQNLRRDLLTKARRGAVSANEKEGASTAIRDVE